MTDQRASGRLPSGKALLAMAAATLVAVASVLVAVWPGSGASSGPQISGSPPAPTAAEVSPVCTTTDPTAALGPAAVLPAAPVSTVTAPAGGVVNFAATSSALYVDTGSRLVTYSLTGVHLSSFALPALFTKSYAATPVIDPNGDIYLSSYYGMKVDKFSPSGALLWSVDPSSGNPTGIFSVGTGSGFQVVVSLVQNAKASVVLNQSNGAASGSFPLVDDGFVTQEANGNLLYAANGYVETVGPTGRVLSTFGSSHIQGNGVHTGSGAQVFYPAQAVQGPDGTIYTADPLYTVEATSPAGILQGSTDLGGHLAFGGWNFALVGSTFYFQSGPPFNASGDAISSFTLASLQSYLTAPQAPSDELGWGAGLSTPAQGNYFPAGTTPAVAATFDPWWVAEASHLDTGLLGGERHHTGRRDGACGPRRSRYRRRPAGWRRSPCPFQRPTPHRGPTRSRLLCSTPRPRRPPRSARRACPTRWAPLVTASIWRHCRPESGSGGPADPRGVALDAQLGLSGHCAA